MTLDVCCIMHFHFSRFKDKEPSIVRCQVSDRPAIARASEDTRKSEKIYHGTFRLCLCFT